MLIVSEEWRKNISGRTGKNTEKFGHQRILIREIL